MHTDTSGIDTDVLAAAIRRGHGLPLGGLTFVPKGEEAYGFVDEAQRVFVRAQPGAALDEALTVASALHGEAGVHAVLAALPMRDGRLTFSFGRHTVAVFPFVHGGSLWEAGDGRRLAPAAAAVLARVHTARLRRPPLRRERFDNPFAEPILRAARAEGGPAAADLRRLFAAERGAILAALEEMERLGAACRRNAPPARITHGDPNLANFLLDERGALHLIDWGDVGFGPVERDLWHLSGPGFADALAAHLEAAGPVPLALDRFAFYQWRWCLQEIADYSGRILEGRGEDGRAWAELSAHLPIPREALEAALEETAAALRACGR